MFIQTELTPNPATIKFIPGHAVMERGSAEFRGQSEAGPSPLAQRLFKIDGVTAVFLASDFISVTCENGSDWSFLKPQVLAAIMEHYLSGMPAVEEVMLSSHKADGGLENEIVVQIRELLETRVRPAVARDGGDVDFIKFEEGIVWLRMKGACAGCPSSTMTLKMGIENMLRHFVPEVKAVEQFFD
ncbi:MAG: NifU family protein [Micavibrio aeruginosavorus]|uniref:NifU family protein n=1 Tax=Micavibrio aeruginosavorus TaxID=349221 RepID=A0A7T5R1C9_9BACT|nr:MAG: NifU family protein [Micavibrio aeruginosavorus]